LDVFDELNVRGITLIFVTHDPEVAERAKRTVLLRDGLIESDKNNGYTSLPQSPPHVKGKSRRDRGGTERAA
jgi:putative ABC transport system ATP-binding protein